MLKSKTVFILGAGASMGKPFEFPSGYDLLKQNLQECKAVEEGNYQKIANSDFNIRSFAALRNLIETTNFTSIDALLGKYTEQIEAGKFMIATCLLPSEVKEKVTAIEDRLDNWMLYLFNKMICDDLMQFGSNVTFVTFNYDRTLDYFLRRQLMDVYRANVKEVEESMKGVPIIHVHGQLGLLSEIAYGAINDPATYTPGSMAAVAAKGINIIHETHINSNEFALARQAIQYAEKIGILGFGFDKTNMERLGLNPSALKKKLIYASTYGLTPTEVKDIEYRLKGIDTEFVPIDGDCLALLRGSPLLFDWA